MHSPPTPAQSASRNMSTVSQTLRGGGGTASTRWIWRSSRPAKWRSSVIARCSTFS
ncbi:uncharacterized protein SCHCODRAFT_02617149 [Schizophyllum commune H4-8]|uniref:uncharacterized protein n=1 Tax=Schizophyllum commune (strain H4-8 / FGSC 9210) TaxID=578458 RepID=UPI00215F1B18|nr:uncharacterized protein SCHCODRAFT_02617149 [Schizophyllum commune H4-8]KAI5894499.1 hypothetical protein SCHCODRAFT_02617149 [Schizophyllum commune H4-8]